MKSITLHGIDDDLEAALRAKSAELSTDSLNTAILCVLRESLGSMSRQHSIVHHDLDHLAGKWSEADLREFEEATAAFGQIDQTLWR